MPHSPRICDRSRCAIAPPSFRTGDTLAAAWFPITGYVSLLATFENGDAVEVGMAGTEGMVGLPLLLGIDRSPVEAIVQAEGRALRIDAEPLRRIAEERPALRAVLLEYTHVFHMLVTMTAACNARHLLEQRLARWLLMAHDRAEGDEFPITHEFLSLMLGVRRAGVTVAAGALQRAGLVRYDQGRMQVTNPRWARACLVRVPRRGPPRIPAPARTCPGRSGLGRFPVRPLRLSEGSAFLIIQLELSSDPL